MIRVGPAGWSYKDWEGIVYPVRPKPDQLSYLADFFNTIEINSTFYRPCTPKTAESWVRRVSNNRDFKFTAKVLQAFTHEKSVTDKALVKEWKDGVTPLFESGKLGAVLIQFPWSFKNEPDSRDYLVRVMETFSELNPVIEFRHAAWDDDEVRNLLRHFGAGVCNIDQPLIGKSLRPRAYVIGRVAYFRYHGRNYQDWFREDAGRDARYNYLYSREKVDQQAEVVANAAEGADETYAVYNNHFRGQAVVNALQLRKRLEKEAIKIPENLPATYPEI
ncbi:MAG: DUF72 domain-containing protein [Acidobacteria bacterium]|nr:MAG: DUF72 domain-containing protein [Acidobacteriota bacterium]